MMPIGKLSGSSVTQKKRRIYDTKFQSDLNFLFLNPKQVQSSKLAKIQIAIQALANQLGCILSLP
jgi:hypothetical protein